KQRLRVVSALEQHLLRKTEYFGQRSQRLFAKRLEPCRVGEVACGRPEREQAELGDQRLLSFAFGGQGSRAFQGADVREDGDDAVEVAARRSVRTDANQIRLFGGSRLSFGPLFRRARRLHAVSVGNEIARARQTRCDV